MTTVVRHWTMHELAVDDAPATEGAGPFSGKPRTVLPRSVRFRVGDDIDDPTIALVGRGVKADGSMAERQYEVEVRLSAAPEWLANLIREVSDAH